MSDRDRIWASQQITLELASERAALREVKAGLVRDANAQPARLTEVESECAEIHDTTRSVLGRIAEVEAEAQRLEEEAARMGIEALSARRDAERLAAQEASLQREVAERRRGVSDTHVTVQRLTGSLLRMDYKLRHRTTQSR